MTCTYFRHFWPILLIIAGCNRPTGNDSTSVETILARMALPHFPANELLLTDFGAMGDSSTNNKPAFDKAISKLSAMGGGQLTVPPGTYIVNGPIHLASNINLHLQKGAILKFGSSPSDYLPVVKTSWEGTMLYNYSPFIYAYQCHDVAITGLGVIDGEASQTWTKWHAKQKNDLLLSRKMNHESVPVESRIFGDGHYLRPHLVQFFECRNILVEGVKLEDSPFWCIHLLKCSNATLRQLRYDAQNKNNDGIDPEYSQDILIEDIDFNNADDNVAIKAGRDDDGRATNMPSQNIIVRNCRFKGLHALVIGSEMSSGVQNVFVEDCTFGGKLKRGIYLKSNPDRGGFIRNVFVKNVQFGQVEDCFYITSFYHNEGSGHATDIQNIRFDSISCQKVTGTAIVIQGFAEMKVKDVYFTNIRIDSVANALSITNAENVIFGDVIVGDLAGVPSSVQ